MAADKKAAPAELSSPDAAARSLALAGQHQQAIDLLTTELAASNARTGQREAELAIVNSVQSGLAAKLDMQAIYDLVGDKIREVFNAQVVGIGIMEPATGLARIPYLVERGLRIAVPTRKPRDRGFAPH